MDAVSSAGRSASGRWKVHTNRALGYRIKYPAGALPNENSLCPGINGERSHGTRFDWADTAGFHAQVGLTVDAAPCSALQRTGSQTSLENLRLHGLPFTRRTFEDGAAGTGYDGVEYTTIANDSCYALVLTLRIGAALNWDEPDRTRVKRSQTHGAKRAQLQFRKMVDSFRLLR